MYLKPRCELLFPGLAIGSSHVLDSSCAEANCCYTQEDRGRRRYNGVSKMVSNPLGNPDHLLS